MALSEEDLEKFENILVKHTQPIKDIVAGHHATLYGPTGDNGLYGDVRELKKSVTSLTRIQWMISGGIAVLEGLTHQGGAIVDKLLGKH